MAHQITALSAVFAHLQAAENHDLKRKLAETQLALERTAMEREDFREGNGYAGGNLTWRRRAQLLQEECEELYDELVSLRGE
jgi:hypothetical protein